VQSGSRERLNDEQLGVRRKRHRLPKWLKWKRRPRGGGKEREIANVPSWTRGKPRPVKRGSVRAERQRTSRNAAKKRSVQDGRQERSGEEPTSARCVSRRPANRNAADEVERKENLLALPRPNAAVLT
jgi:hypothetical protein